MARDILDLGADVFDDTVVEAKHRISPKKRNYIIGLSITGALLAGIVTFTVIAANSWLLDVDNLEKIQFYFTPETMLEEGEEQTLTLYKLDPEVKYPSTFRIPEKVQGYKVAHVADGAFSGHDEIKKVIFTKYVESIGKNAFSNCTSLEEFVWNQKLNSIGEDAFVGTKFLSNLQADSHGICSIPSGTLIYLGTDYFEDNTALVSNELDAASKEAIKIKYGITDNDFFSFADLGVTNFVDGVFANNKKISYIDFPSFLTKTGNKTFYNCSNLKGINFIHSKISSIGNNAFEKCSLLKDITFSEELSELGDEAFASTAIEVIPALHHINTIGNGVFRNCKELETVVYPASEKLTYVPENMFADCSSLDTIYWTDDTNSGIDYIEEIKIGAFSNTNFSNFVVPKKVTRILDKTFEKCGELTTVSLFGNPDNFATYAFDEIAYMGLWQYANSSLTLNLDGYDGTKNITVETDGVHVTLSKIEGTYPGENVEFVIPTDYLDEIAQYQENPVTDEELVEVVLGVSDASNYYQLAFYNDTSILVNIASEFHYDELGTLQPGKLQGIFDIRSKAFNECPKLTTIKLYDNSYSDIAGKSDEGTFNFPLALERTNNDSYNNTTNYTFAHTNAEVINVPTNQTDIGSYAFANMANLKHVNFAPNARLAHIWSNAFENDVSLESVSLPDSLTDIRAASFAGCTSLTSFEFNNANIATINAKTFQNCKNLTSIKIPASVTGIKFNAFDGVEKLNHVVLSENINELNNNAFINCRNEADDSKMPIFIKLTTSAMKKVNAADGWYDSETAFDSYLVEYQNEVPKEKEPGISYWNGDVDAPQEIKVISVDTIGELTNTEFSAGEDFVPAGLTFKANYDDSTFINDVSSKIVWDALQAGDTSATGYYTVGSVTIEITVDGITVA